MAILLARTQFGFTISLHIILAALSIGLSAFLAVLEGLWLLSKKQRYIDTYNYWLKILALNVAVGAVTGVVMEFQFSTNWGPFSIKAGPVIGPLLLYEVMVAFFLEAGFLGVMLFGMKKVGATIHFVATCVVATGSVLSAFWILSASSWMQTPDGANLGPDGNFVVQSWMRVIFNPSFPYRFIHMTLAAYLVTAFVVAGVGAWHLLHHPNNASARVMVSLSLWLITFAAPAQVLAGDQHGEDTLTHQPQKVAAMEGDWDTPREGDGEPLILFAIPSMDHRRNFGTIAIPRVASLYLRHNLTGVIRGLNGFPKEDIPNVPIVFFAFRAMAGLGFLMVGVGLTGLMLRMRGRLYVARWFLWSMVAMAPAGVVAMLAGWTVTEVGRQPFLVWGLLRTSQGASATPLSQVAASLGAIALVYAALYGAGLIYVARLLLKPPKPGEEGPVHDLADRTGGGPGLLTAGVGQADGD
jgi:cytochrome d ubiquinol oxidase subunit I